MMCGSTHLTGRGSLNAERVRPPAGCEAAFFTTERSQTMATEATDRTRSTQTSGNSADQNRSRSTKRTGGGTESTLFGGSTGAMIGAAAAGVAVGLMANLGRKVAVQAPTKLAGDWDEALKAEHAAVLKLFDALQ